MTNISMKAFGSILTGREFGRSSAEAVLKGPSQAIHLDFSGVLSMGSSFGEEFIPKVAAACEGRVTASGLNGPVRNVLRDIAKATGIAIGETSLE